MQIYKFGGASVKDADGVINLAKILKETGCENTLIVISAMGKTTNALEEVVKEYFLGNKNTSSLIENLKNFHYQILNGLFKEESHPVYYKIDGLFSELSSFLERNKSPKHSFVYDQVVCFGELISTTIISYFLNEKGIKNAWLDARNLIKTDSKFREGTILWEETFEAINQSVNKNILNITQGFIGSDSNFFSTTLGREGSDYSAAIFAYCLDAESVTIWKDVPGVLNADPRYFSQPQLLKKIPYKEAIELAFYGASVIHPKTLQPLKQKNIPLFVRSFIDFSAEGSAVCNSAELEPKIPCFILKKNQNLISLSSLDFSFIEEENLSHIFNLLSKHQVKISVLQNSAISFSLCVDNKYNNLDQLLKDLQEKFKVECQKEVNLYTIRHADENAIKMIENDKEILLKQVLQDTIQLVCK